MQHAHGQQMAQESDDLREQIDEDNLNGDDQADLLDEVSPVEKALTWFICRERSGFDRHRSTSTATWVESKDSNYPVC